MLLTQPYSLRSGFAILIVKNSPSVLGLMIRRTRTIAAATAGTVLLLLTAFFYTPILITEIYSSLVVEGVNYVGDTLLFAATALLAGFGADYPTISKR